MDKEVKEKIIKLIKLRYQAINKLLTGNVKELKALRKSLAHAK